MHFLIIACTILIVLAFVSAILTDGGVGSIPAEEGTLHDDQLPRNERSWNI